MALIFWLAGRQVDYPYAARVVQLETGVALLAAVSLAALLGGAGDHRAHRRLAGAWVLAAVLAAVAAVGQVLFAAQRGTAGFANPNHLAAFLVVSLPLAVALGRDQGRVWGGSMASFRLLAGLILGVLLAGLLASGSRAGLLAAPACLGVLRRGSMGGGSARRRRRLASLAVVVLLAFAAVFWWRFADGTDIYRYDRLKIWPQAMEMAREAPVLGIGPGQFHHQAGAHNFPRQEGAVRFGRVFRSPHSHLLLLLVETGGVGLMIICLAFFWMFRVASRVSPRPPFLAEGGSFPEAIRGAAGLGLVGLLIFSLVDEPMAHPPLRLGAALLLALALPAGGQSRGRIFPLSRLAVLVVLATLFLGAGLMPVLAEQSALLAARCPHPVKRSRLLERAAWCNPYQPFYPGDEAALLLSHAAHPLDIVSYARIRALADGAVRLAPGEAGFRVTEARLERRACLELFRDRTSCDRAVAQYRAAVDRAPKDPRIMREGAAFLSRLGRVGEAVAWLRRAVAVEPAYVGAWEDLVRRLEDE
ncbi:MAG: O-antigen ligase family protein, partial [Acidobacteriota bacterium]